MINLINGSLSDPQENICWTENKSSATILLNTHPWKEGEVLVVGYSEDIMIGVGIKSGVGPSCYRTIIDRSSIIVAEILDYTPDVSYYAFDQRYLIKEEEGLVFTRKYLDPTTEEIKVEKLEVSERCVIIETSTGDIWICDPPKLINFFDLTTKSSIEDIIDLGNGEIMVSLADKGKVWENLCFVSPSEKTYLAEMVFSKNFTVSISGSSYNGEGVKVTDHDPCKVVKTVFTLTSKYSGESVDLDEIPEGWVRVDTGTYTKTVKGNNSASSGSIVCKLTRSGYTGSKTAANVTVSVWKYVFIIYSQDEIFKITGANMSFLTSSAALGTKTVTPPKDNYVWFAFPTTMRPSKITQLGVGYVSGETKIIEGVTKDGVNLGNYIIYRSSNPGNGKSQEININ